MFIYIPSQARYTPLSLAAMNGHLPICEFLVDSGANKEYADVDDDAGLYEDSEVMELYNLALLHLRSIRLYIF